MPPRFPHFPSIQSSTPSFRRQSCLFHASRVLRAEEVVDHYKILGLESNASAADIKKSVVPNYSLPTPSLTIPYFMVSLSADPILRSFYTLSKKHHPDRNPNDTHAAERFVKISEAYAILGNPPKRDRYDRETLRPASQNAPRGSYSSSAPFGARPASGLSKRRTPFRGPPPSFYGSGGYGPHGAKRQGQADATASAHASAASGSASTAGGFGPAGSPDGLDNDVPHFDRQGHIRTQVQQDQRRVRRTGEGAIDYSTGGSMLLNFFFVSGILAVACLVPVLFVKGKNARESRKETP